MATLDDLLRYKDKVVLKNQKGKTIKTAWVKVLGDEDVKEAFRASRLASAAHRALLRNKETDTYKDERAAIEEQTREQHIELILASKENVFANEAPLIVPREDLPEMEEVSAMPDAPTLEEQERLDTAIEELDNKFRNALEEYIQTKLNEVKAEIEEKSDEEVLEMAWVEYVNIEALRAFMEELANQQGFRGTFEDEACKKKGFSSVEGFKNAHASIKNQIINAYKELELSNDDIKN